MLVSECCCYLATSAEASVGKVLQVAMIYFIELTHLWFSQQISVEKVIRNEDVGERCEKTQRIYYFETVSD